MPGSPRRRRWSSNLIVLAVATALTALGGPLGCGGSAGPKVHTGTAPPLAAPNPITFLHGPVERKIGELRPATDAEVALIHKPIPLGTVLDETVASDADTMLRITGPARIVDVRMTEHEHRVRRVKVLGPTPEGLFRYVVAYVDDTREKVEGGEASRAHSPAHGKSYVVDMGPSGIRVFTEQGYTPPPAEVLIVQSDYVAHVKQREEDQSLRQRPQAGPPPPGGAVSLKSSTAEITERLRRSFTDSGFNLAALDVTLLGVRDTDGAPCAVFKVVMRGHKDNAEEMTMTRVTMDASGEYSLRLGDGWEAELLMGGNRRVQGQTIKNGVPLTLDSMGYMRMSIQSRYDLSGVATHRNLEQMQRAPSK